MAPDREPDSNGDGAPTFGVEEARQVLGANIATAVDIRDLQAWQADRIPGSIQSPVEQLAEAVEGLETERVIVVCEDGERSAEVAWQLKGRGIDAASIEGGFKAWVDGGFPLQPSGDTAEIPNPDPDEELEGREDSAVDPKVF
jgi:rhodanese-related sulfurtransferase